MIGIIGAMDLEIKTLLHSMKHFNTLQIADKDFYVGSLFGKEVVIAKSGIGKVNATITTVLMAERFSIDFMINIGVAGGISPVEVGDIIIATELAYFDVSIAGIDDIPFGKMADDPLLVETAIDIRSQMIHLAKLHHMPHRIGRLVSGDQFVLSLEMLQPILAEVENVLACEMEGMAIAMTCFKLKIPFVSIRGISDVIDAENQQIIYQNVVEKVADQTTKLVLLYLQESNG